MAYKDKENRKEYNKKWRETHKNEIVAYRKEHRDKMLAYYKEHRDEMLAHMKQYYKAHQDEISTYQKQYRKAHRNEMSVYEKQWYEQNKDKCNQRAKAWKNNHIEQNREIDRKHNFKRRSLGFIPLNEPFEGSEAHHICRSFVIYIPKELHQSVWHNVWMGENMEEINKLAWQFLYKQRNENMQQIQ